MAVFEFEPERLLDRAAFKKAVFLANNGRCVFCARPAVDAHHILERKLFRCGGYYPSNGAPVCEQHHWKCETTAISVEAARAATRVRQWVIPDGFDPAGTVDKWGNGLIRDGDWKGYRVAGPLADDDGMRKVLTAGGVKGRLLRKAPDGDTTDEISWMQSLPQG